MRFRHLRWSGLAATLWLGTVTGALAQGGAESAAPDTPKTLLDVLQAGGWSMIPLIGLSVVAMTMILYGFMTLRKRYVVTPQFLNSVEAYLSNRDLKGLLARSSHEPEALARVVHATLHFSTRNPEAKFHLLREIAEAEGSRQASRMYQQVSYLYDIGVIAPMVGLAGTVTGMINSFSVIGMQAQALRPSDLANGVAEALIATAGGLVVGIPAMVFYSFFKGRVQFLVAELEAQATHVLAMIESATETHRGP